MHKVIYCQEEKRSYLIKAGYTDQRDPNLGACTIPGKIKEVNSIDEDVKNSEALPIFIKF